MYELQIGTCHGHLPSVSTRIKSCAAAAADFQDSEMSSGWRAEMRQSVLWGKTGITGLQIFSGTDFMNPILIPPYI